MKEQVTSHANNATFLHTKSSTATPASLIISSQVAGVNMESRTLQENPVMITFTVEGVGCLAKCCSIRTYIGCLLLEFTATLFINLVLSES